MSEGRDLRVFAAASLSDVLREVAPRFTEATGDTLVFNFGGSGALARQIGAGARADVFIAADELRMDQLAAAGCLVTDTRCIVALNTLVVVVAKEEGAPIRMLDDLAGADVRRIALGEPATVPAGGYARAHLEQVGLWAAVRSRVVPLDNVRAVLAAVESGNVDAGFVYRTDALTSRRVRIVVEVSREAGPKIVYSAAVVAHATSLAEGRAFVTFLRSEGAQAVFAKHGFLPPD